MVESFTVNLYHDGVFRVNPLQYANFDCSVIDDVDFDVKMSRDVITVGSTMQIPLLYRGIKENFDAGKVGKEIVFAQQYVLLPLCTNRVNAVIKPVNADGPIPTNSTNSFNTASPFDTAISLNFRIAGKSSFVDPSKYLDDPDMPELEDIIYLDDEEEVGAEADLSILETNISASPIPTTRVHKDHPDTQIIGDLTSAPQTRSMTRMVKEQGGPHQINDEDFHTCMFACFLSQEEPKRVHQALKGPSWIEAMQEKLLQFKMQKVWVLVDLPKGKRAIGSKWVLRNKKDERVIVIRNKARLVVQGHTQEEGIDYDEVFSPVARIEAIWLFLAYASFIGFMVYQMDVKSAFLYGTIEEEVYVCQPSGFEDPNYPDKVYKVVKALYGLHQAPGACKELSSPKKTALGKDISNPFMAGSLPKTKWHFLTAVSYKLMLFGLTKDATVKLMLLGFDQVMNFLNAHVILYALMVNPTIYVSCIKQFWATATLKKVNDVVQLRALIDGNKVVITEDVIQQVLRLDYADGVECLPNEEIFSELTRMGYEKPPPKLTFYKAFFSVKWKFLIHTLVQCVSAKRTTWNEFSCSMTSDVICLATGRKFNFSKYIFNNMVRNVDIPSKFFMYPRFLQVVINNQVDDLTSLTTRYTSPALTQKVFANMRRVRKGFSGVETPLFASMLVKPHAAEEEDEVEEQPTTTFVSSMTLLNSLLETCATLSQKVNELEQDKHNQALEIIKLKKREDASKQGRGKIEAIDVDKDITLVDIETQVDMDAELQGRIDDDNTATKDVNAAEPTVFDDEEKKLQPENNKKKMFWRELKCYNNSMMTKKKTLTGMLLLSKFKKSILTISGNQSFEEMLKGFDRKDLVSLWRLVKEKFNTVVPNVDKEKALWVELKRLFEPDEDDVLWKLQREGLSLVKWIHDPDAEYKVTS
uniref:Reverse transcriptase Ty1/copia-type domain-containing protein n=1 Tax=Tanacetum cinerariifolium TaxID=118510 RepID=A0A6L2KN69_TANCI|nr:hypothetical protein [Tanacetum cinerariifolium]